MLQKLTKSCKQTFFKIVSRIAYLLWWKRPQAKRLLSSKKNSPAHKCKSPSKTLVFPRFRISFRCWRVRKTPGFVTCAKKGKNEWSSDETYIFSADRHLCLFHWRARFRNLGTRKMIDQAGKRWWFVHQTIDRKIGVSVDFCVSASACSAINKSIVLLQ